MKLKKLSKEMEEKFPDELKYIRAFYFENLEQTESKEGEL